VLLFELIDLSWPLKQRWFWFLFFFLLAAVMVPMIFLGVLLMLPPYCFVIALLALVTVWFILKTRKEWKSKHSGEKHDNVQQT